MWLVAGGQVGEAFECPATAEMILAKFCSNGCGGQRRDRVMVSRVAALMQTYVPNESSGQRYF